MMLTNVCQDFLVLTSTIFIPGMNQNGNVGLCLDELQAKLSIWGNKMLLGNGDNHQKFLVPGPGQSTWLLREKDYMF